MITLRRPQGIVQGADFGQVFSSGFRDFPCAPGRIRTSNLLIRSQMLYPVELRARADYDAACAAFSLLMYFANFDFLFAA